MQSEMLIFIWYTYHSIPITWNFHWTYNLKFFVVLRYFYLKINILFYRDKIILRTIKCNNRFNRIRNNILIILGVVKRNPLFFHSISCKNNGFLFTTPNMYVKTNCIILKYLTAILLDFAQTFMPRIDITL